MIARRAALRAVLCAAASALNNPGAQAQQAPTAAQVGAPVTLRVVEGGALPLVVAATTTVDVSKAGPALARALQMAERRQLLPSRFAFQPGSLRPLIVAAVRVRLSRPGANWDGRRGTALRGLPNRVLAAEVLAAVQASPLGRAFLSAGYDLNSSGRVDGIEVARAAGGGMLPTEIADMGLVVTRRR